MIVDICKILSKKNVFHSNFHASLGWMLACRVKMGGGISSMFSLEHLAITRSLDLVEQLGNFLGSQSYFFRNALYSGAGTIIL